MHEVPLVESVDDITSVREGYGVQFYLLADTARIILTVLPAKTRAPAFIRSHHTHTSPAKSLAHSSSAPALPASAPLRISQGAAADAVIG
jgi:hypothetical protein